MANPKARTETKIAILISIKRLNALERNCSHEVGCMCVHVCVHVCVCMCAIKYASKFKWKAARLKCRRGRKAEPELLPCCINWDSAVVLAYLASPALFQIHQADSDCDSHCACASVCLSVVRVCPAVIPWHLSLALDKALNCHSRSQRPLRAVAAAEIHT